MWQIRILTLFPESYPGALADSVTGRALGEKWEVHSKNIRDYAKDAYQSVDDTPCGGGGGMVLKADVLGDAIDDFFDPQFPYIYLTPRGKIFNQKVANQLTTSAKGINLLCGRFEGVDERVLIEYPFTEISLGDFVLSSGDVAAMPFLDCCIRQLEGVLGNNHSLNQESFGQGDYESLLEYPHYTKPGEWRGHSVPDVLLSGHHGKIEEWRLEQAKRKTKTVRPDLWDQFNFGEKK